MKLRLNGRLADFAASGIVMLALLLGALLVSTAPALIQAFGPHGAQPLQASAAR